MTDMLPGGGHRKRVGCRGWRLVALLLVALLLPVSALLAQEEGDSTGARFPVPPGGGNSPMYLNNPSNMTTTVEYDPATHGYIRYTKIGNIVISKDYMSFEEYQDWQMQQLMDSYWADKKKTAITGDDSEGLLSNIPGFSEISRKLELLNGVPEISIVPTGSVDLTLQFVDNYRKDPSIDENKRNQFRFEFDEDIRMTLNAKIGDLMNFDINWNTEATFDFENQIKLKYEGKEDDILQLLEAADISFPLNTTLIKGSQRLFGVHTKLKFGKLLVDAVASQKETSTENMQVQGGASSQEFEIRADEYEENRHYFIAQYFYDNYNKSMSTLPVVNSNIKIIRMEVWRTNIGAAVTNNRNIVAVTDLGEQEVHSPGLIAGSSQRPDMYRSNNFMSLVNLNALRNINSVSSYLEGIGFVGGEDYVKLENARLLNNSEYTYNNLLGFITLSQPLTSDQVLAVAFQYQVIGDTTVYQVGELTTDGVNDPNTLVVKLLRSTSLNTRSPLWKLMMKNIYFLKSTQISRENFRLNVLYESPEGGVGMGYFTEGPMEGKPLVEVFGLDRMDASQNYYYADGVFDWFDSAAFKGGTIQATTGRIYFPYVEPFGKDLRELLGDQALADRYCFDSLYTMTQVLAQQYADKNKFYLEGYFTSSVSGEISLGYSVTQGSVTVTAGGMPLIENVDYTVDYTMGTVRIINESILSSGTPISVSSENSSFSMMTKTMLGLHLDYEIDPDFHIGATAMNLREKPMTQKNNFGDEPTSNSIWGLDLNYRHEAPFITRIIDKLPGIQTKAPSTLTLQAEFAHFIPGMANTGSQDGKSTYIDDFEGAESSIDLKSTFYWHLASTPQDYRLSSPMFPESAPGTGLAYGYNRGLLAWYRISDVFYKGDVHNIDMEDLSNPYARRIYEQEVFPNKQLAAGDPTIISELNLAFYPEEKGPYNYDVSASPYSAGINSDGNLNNPQSRWAGIMRDLTYTDFESTNIETIEFWLMDPFIDPETGQHDDTRTGGTLYINLGDISEDILRDGRKAFENGLPTGPTEQDFLDNPVDTTIWGRVPVMQAVVNAFDNEESGRMYQDVGFDGLGSTNGIDDERTFFADYVNSIGVLFGTGSEAYRKATEDPSNDDYRYFRSTYYDERDIKVNDRYKRFSAPEGNSNVEANNTEAYSTQGTNYPDVEDINKDNTLSESENYYQYVIHLDPTQMEIGQNHIVDIHDATNIKLANGSTMDCRWYQFRIPIREPDQMVGNMNGYQSIRFMRMFLRDFQEPVILRFATLELVYGTWRKYTEDLLQPGDYPTGSEATTTFTLSTVNIEENGNRSPVPYVLPPGIERETWYSSSSTYMQLNEQALSLDIQDLASGDARAIYRNSQYDMRYYGKLKMFVHAEKKFESDNLYDEDLVLFVRLGSDYTNNYYEYEVPLHLTPWNTSAESRDLIWPTANNVEIDLQNFVSLKTNRNRLIRSGSTEYSSTMLYSEMGSDGRRYTVMGSPNLGKVKVVMVGVRNPKKQTLDDGNDMLPKSAIVWVNELRLSDYINRGGWAAMGLARTNLADVGNLALYTSYTTSGFGNLEDNLTSLELINNFQLQSTLNLEMGRFLPEDWGVHIPLYLDYNNQIGSPEYNPLDPDVLLKNDLQTYQTLAERDSIKEMTRQKHSTTNLTLTNIHKDRVGKSALTPHFYDIENFSLSYAYSGEHTSDDDIEYYNKAQHRGGLNYTYSILQPKQFKPFEKSPKFQDKKWKVIHDFNLYLQPKNMSFSTEVYRDREETLLRNKSAALVIMNPTYFKQFTWRRDYNLAYDLARSLRFQYDATANARIDEPPGLVDRSANDSLWYSILRGGTMQNFRQHINITWDVPLNKLPYLEFIRLPLSYNTTYQYTGTTQALASQGSVLNNTTIANATMQANFQTLYNKFPLLKKAYAKKPASKKANDKSKDADKDKNKLDKKRGMEQKADDTRVADSLKRAERMEMLRDVGYFGLRLITMPKTINATYNHSYGSTVAGYMGEATIFGLDPQSYWTPGLGYVMGSTTPIVEELLRYDLLSVDTLMNTPHLNNDNRIFNMTATLEPLRDFKVDINCTQNYSSHEEYYYKYISSEDAVMGPLSYIMMGNYTTTAWAFGTAFKNPDELYRTFLDNRLIVANRLAEMNPDPYTDDLVLDSVSGQYFPAGYGPNQQTVLLTAFLSTYMNSDANSRSFSPFLGLPLPNWTINYNGLSKLEFLKKWFTNIAITHKYLSTYTIGNFYTDAAIPAADPSYDYGSETVMNGNGDFIAPVSTEGVLISEQFNPLIRLSLFMVNGFNLNLSVQKARTLNLSFSNNQLTETKRDGVTLGMGYRIKDVEVHIKTAEKTHDLKSDLVLQLNITYNDNHTLIRKLSQNPNNFQITSGMKVWMAEISAEYAVSSSLTLRAFFQTNINDPYITNTYLNSTTKGGITLRFSF